MIMSKLNLGKRVAYKECGGFLLKMSRCVIEGLVLDSAKATFSD